MDKNRIEKSTNIQITANYCFDTEWFRRYIRSLDITQSVPKGVMQKFWQKSTRSNICASAACKFPPWPMGLIVTLVTKIHPAFRLVAQSPAAFQQHITCVSKWTTSECVRVTAQVNQIMPGLELDPNISEWQIHRLCSAAGKHTETLGWV